MAAQEIRQYNKKRQLVDVDYFLASRDDYYLMCISKAQLYAVRKLIKTRLLWPTSYVKERYEQSYLLPSAGDWDDIEEHIAELIYRSEGVEMCNAALINAIENLSASVRLSSCCFEAGAGTQTIDGGIYYGSETPLEEPTSFGPGEEFGTEEEYNLHKCATANAIVNGVILSLNNLSLLTLLNLVAASLLAAVVGLGLLFVPPVAIVVAVVVSGLTFAFFSELSQEIDDNKETLVCAIYSASGAVDAYDQFKQAIENFAVDLGVIEIQVGPVLDLVMQMAPIDTFNAMYEAVSLPSIPGDPVDCAVTCVECPYAYAGWGVYDEVLQVATSTMNNNAPYVSIRWSWDNGSSEWCGPQMTVSVTETTPPRPDNAAGEGHRLWSQSGTQRYSSNTPPTSVTGCGRYTGAGDIGDQAFEVSFNLVEE